jgi:putative ABC transport system permease protein
MMSSRWKKVWADFWSNKPRTVLMILTITVGVFAVGFVKNMTVMVNRYMEEDYQTANPSEATINSFPLTEELVENLRKLPGVGGLEGRSTTIAFILLPNGKRINTQFYALNSFDEPQVNLIKPAVAGEPLPQIAEKEFWLDRSASGLGLQPGEMVRIELADGTIRDVKFGGYVHSVTLFSYNIVNTASGFLTPDTMQWMGGSEYYDQLVMSVTDNPSDRDHVTEVAKQISDRLKKNNYNVGVLFIYNPGHHFAWSVTQGIMFVLSSLGWLTVLLGALLIINSITALMSQQVKQIGVMKAIGANTSQILVMYVVLVLTFGLLAFAISVPMSQSSAYRIARGMARYLNFDVGPMVVDGAVIVQQAIVAILVPLLAALFPILNSVGITVREAISNYGLGGMSAKPNKKSEVSKRAAIFPRPLRISFRNAFRRRARLSLTLISLVLGGGIFIAVMNLWDSFNLTINNVGGYFLADVNLSFDRYQRFEEVNSIALTVPGVVSTEGWLGGGGKLFTDDRDEKGTDIVFNAPPADSRLIKPVITDGRWIQLGDENALVIGNHLLAVRPDLKVGDWVTLEIANRKTKWQIIGIYRLPGNSAPPPVYVPYEYYSHLIGVTGQAYSLRVLTDKHDQDTQAAIRKQLETTFKANGIPITFSQIGTEWSQSQRATTDILAYFMLVMAILIAIVGGLGLMGTMSINVLERTREIGVMRAIGASNGDIQWIVIAEGAAIGLISWLFSLLLAIPLTSALVVGVGKAVLQAPIPYIYGMSGALTWLIGILVIAAVSSALPAQQASRLTVKDTLAYE